MNIELAIVGRAGPKGIEPGNGEKVTLTKTRNLIGRAKHCDVCILCDQVSRWHCELSLLDDEVWVRDVF
ncbi:MAG: FHA domain-containing protein, partial [Planctomycetales bacterium]